MQPKTVDQFTVIRTDAERDAAEAYLIHLNEAPDAASNLAEIDRIGALIVQYERENGHTFDTPFTLREVLEAEMYKRKLKQRGMAELLQVHETRLSELMRGKREMTIDFARKLYTTLHIPAETVLTLTVELCSIPKQ